MARYIDADALTNEIMSQWGCDPKYYENDTDLVTAIHACADVRMIRLIAKAPTVDMVEVVRCNDCVHHKDAPQTTDVWCDRLDGLLPKDWFCADGERREEDAEIH